MKTSLLTLTALLAGIGAALAGTTFLDSAANGRITPGVGPVKIVAVDVQGAATNQTVTLSRVSNSGAITNALLATITATNGTAQVAVDGGAWIFADDTILRGGTATGARVRLIVQQ